MSSYDAALIDFEAVVEGKSDPTVLFLYADTGQILYIASPQDWADLTFYENPGVQLAQPEFESLTYWEEPSLEQALKYPADVVFNSTRPGTLTIEVEQSVYVDLDAADFLSFLERRGGVFVVPDAGETSTTVAAD